MELKIKCFECFIFEIGHARELKKKVTANAINDHCAPVLESQTKMNFGSNLGEQTWKKNM